MLTNPFKMKRFLCFLTVLVTAAAAFGQIKFVPAYFINNDGQRTECEIKDVDWANNPTSFEYRSGQSPPEQLMIFDVKEFGITNGSVFRRFTVNIDRTSDDPNNLTISRNPEFKSETLFLRLLVTGKGVLYEYVDRGLKRYFYQVDQGEMQQLVYLRYLGTATDRTGDYETGYIESNNLYKQQLFNELKCGDIKQSDFANLKYDRANLMKIFKRYNKCQGVSSESVEAEHQSGTTHLTLRAGTAYNGFTLTNASNSTTTSLDKALAFRVGLEIEIVMPFNKGLWSVVVEPDFQSYSSKNTSGSTQLDYKSIDLGVALRRYLILSDQRAFYVNLGFVYGLPLGGSEGLKIGNTPLKISSGVNVSAGIGYRINSISAEFFYGFGRGLMGDYVAYNSNYSGPGLMIGYRLK